MKSVLPTTAVISTPVCFPDALTDVAMNNITLKTLLDTRKSESYMVEYFVLRHRLVIRSFSAISTASTSRRSHAKGYCYVNI